MIQKRSPWTAMFLLLICFFSHSAFAEDGVFTAITDDGVNLKMKRYRPSSTENFRDEGAPVLLFPGIMCNVNQFLTITPEERQSDYADMVLPEPVAKWAGEDPFIADDPMLYYSVAHFLWLKGYDPWFANYRGIGRGNLKSGRGNLLTTLDVWAIMDVQASIRKVIEVTQQNPFIGGHSTGGFLCYAYLQGTYFDSEELQTGYDSGYLPHVKSDPELARIRNSEVRGYIAIDPGLIPPLPTAIDSPDMWALFNETYYLDFDWLMDKVVNPLITNSNVFTTSIDVIFGTIYTLDSYFGDYLKVFSQLDVWYPHNTHPNIDDFWIRYCFTSTYFRALSHWGDIGLHQAIREHWRNGVENLATVIGPDPDPGNDGYYYYDQHMANVSVPTIALLSHSSGLVISDDVINLLMDAKTPHEYDAYHHIPDTAHVDIVNGLNAPTITFPLIGEWLDTVSGGNSDNSPAGDSTDDVQGENTATTGQLNEIQSYKPDEEGTTCFIQVGASQSCGFKYLKRRFATMAQRHQEN